jgi:hypothetical protein
LFIKTRTTTTNNQSTNRALTAGSGSWAWLRGRRPCR